HFLRRALPPQNMKAGYPAIFFLRVDAELPAAVLAGFRPNVAGANAVHAYAMRTQLDRPAFRQRADGEFGRVVCSEIRLSNETAYRRHVNNGAPAGLLHQRYAMLRHERRADDIDPERLVPILRAGFQ